mgnify:CR=1 FL=1
MSTLPKPLFASCDETSLKLKWDLIDVSTLSQLSLQYKEIFETWEQAKDCPIPIDSVEGAKLSEADVVDLKPGTPYYVRLSAMGKDGEAQVGPETVFDTKPIDCTPKNRKCIIS